MIFRYFSHMNAPDAPLIFDPVLRDYIWGGRRLASLFGRSLPPGITAESWEISGHPTAPTRVSGGPHDGTPLTDLVAAYGESLCGSRARPMLARGRFPLLVKLLDAAQPLSLQVHPDDAYATRHEHGDVGKTEMWYILHADAGAHLIFGFDRPLTSDDFAAAIAAGTPEPLLHRLPVAAGDAVYIPAGSVHAIMQGIVLAEIQQNSDTTYRVWDWGRTGADGRPRPLHIDKALDVIDFAQLRPVAARPLPPDAAPGARPLVRTRGHDASFTHELLVHSPHFRVERIRLAAGDAVRTELDGESFEIWMCVEGTVRAATAHGEAELPAVRSTLLPASAGTAHLTAEAPATLLRVYLP
jgi:mannose-6-phosphate isomerase